MCVCGVCMNNMFLYLYEYVYIQAYIPNGSNLSQTVNNDELTSVFSSAKAAAQTKPTWGPTLQKDRSLFLKIGGKTHRAPLMRGGYLRSIMVPRSPLLDNSWSGHNQNEMLGFIDTFLYANNHHQVTSIGSCRRPPITACLRVGGALHQRLGLWQKALGKIHSTKDLVMPIADVRVDT